MRRKRTTFFILCLSLLFASLVNAAEPEDAKRGRYVFLYESEDARYYLDYESMKQEPHPYLKETLLRVWLKVQLQEAGAYTYPPQYVLQQYDLRLTKPQYQLRTILNAGETPKSKDAVRLPYREARWQEIYPESLEEILYRRILRHCERNRAESKEG